ncbi:MAG: leucine-rich repeat domain-containing protein [Clostridiales bacterium]|nr:leucine-rich repeat domain-containing protein [Clostridiales bacterium]
MKKNFKWLINVATICLCLCAIAIGVYAAKQASLTATGTIGFTATNVYAEVSGQTSGAAEEVTFNTITIDSTKTGNPYTDTSTWSGKNINFKEEGTAITLTFTITNLSTGRPLYAKVTNTSSATNLSVEVNETDFTETEWLTIPAKTEGSTANTTTIVISLSVANDNESVTGSYGFNIQLQSTEPVVEEVLDASSYTNLGFDYVSEQDNTVYVYGQSEATGNIEIPSKVKYNNVVCTVVQIGDNTNPGSSKVGFFNTKITSISIPGTVKTIGAYSFMSVSTLTNLTLPEGLEEIGAQAFTSCGFTSVIIPNSVTKIDGGTPFSGVNKIIISDINKFAQINAAGDLSYNYALYLSTDLENPITNVVLDNSVTKISAVFAGCDSITSIQIPGSVTSIAASAFQNCDNLAQIKLSNGITKIDNAAFFTLTSLVSIEIPKSVTSIGESAFYNCNALTDVYYAGTETEWNNISIATENTPLSSVTMHYNYVG